MHSLYSAIKLDMKMSSDKCSDFSTTFSDPLHIEEKSDIILNKDESDLILIIDEDIKTEFPNSNQRKYNNNKEETIKEELNMIHNLKEEFTGDKSLSHQLLMQPVKREEDDEPGSYNPQVVMENDLTCRGSMIGLQSLKNCLPNYSTIFHQLPSPSIQQYSTDLKLINSLGILGKTARRCPEKARIEFVKTDPFMPPGFRVRVTVRGDGRDGSRIYREYLNTGGTIIFCTRTAAWDYYKLVSEEAGHEPPVVVWLPEKESLTGPGPSLMVIRSVLPASSTSAASVIVTHQKKNQQERDRREALEMDMYKLRTMLLSAATMLQVATDYCVDLRHQLS